MNQESITGVDQAMAWLRLQDEKDHKKGEGVLVKRLYSIKEVSAILGISEGAVRNHIWSRGIPLVRIGTRTLLDVKDLQETGILKLDEAPYHWSAKKTFLVKEVSQYLAVSGWTVRHIVCTYVQPICLGKFRLLNIRELDAWVEKQKARERG